MTTISEAGAGRAGRLSRNRTLPWWAFGLANVAVIAVLSVVSWWLLVDPAWSPLNSYPQPYTAALFWTIISVVWIAFNFEWLGPTRLGQPARGIVGVVLSLVIGCGITYLLSHFWGRFDPSFAAAREGGAGYTTGNLAVLFAFFFFVTCAVNWSHWPFAAGSVGQPFTGLAELGVLGLVTAIGYAIFILPNLATWAVPGTAVMSVPTVIGWFYSCVVSVVVTGVITENWPWRLAGAPSRVMPVSIVGNLVLGTILYFINLNVAKLLMGPANAAALGPAVTLYAAEFGVCWVVWMIAWANAFGNPPGAARSLGATLGIRVAVTYLLGVVTFLAYYYFFAGVVLHEPVVEGTSLRGDALGFLDWVVLWMLWYILFFESIGLPRMRTDTGETFDATETPLTHGTENPHERPHYH